MARLKPGKYEPQWSLEERLEKTAIAKASIRSTYYIIRKEHKRKSEEAQRIIYLLREKRIYKH